jgi:hypothetical protein
MTQYLITFRTLTQAQRAARILERAGYTVTLRRTPAGLSRSGCGYALNLRRGAAEAAELLKTNGLWTGRLFRREEDGEYREVLP